MYNIILYYIMLKNLRVCIFNLHYLNSFYYSQTVKNVLLNFK